ncbi:hypothetical protein [uncultured Hymenobacter sp.]|uniref:hypothetical protein n=1 Tax=uncultured Hymenobacter sp. TaxID=170016 RepID=UPI0035CC8A56
MRVSVIGLGMALLVTLSALVTRNAQLCGQTHPDFSDSFPALSCLPGGAKGTVEKKKEEGYSPSSLKFIVITHSYLLVKIYCPLGP